MSGLNLSQFKKVAFNDKTTVLRHSSGHKLTVAHSKLSSDLRQQLENLPVYKSDGGGPEDDPSADQPTEVEGNDNPAEDMPTEVAGNDNPAADVSEAEPQVPEAAATPTAEAPEETAPEDAPDAAPAKPDKNMQLAMDTPKTTEQVAQEMNGHDQEFQQDLNKGAIHPKTYQDLFHEKGTLGKIGMIFGMLLGGAGSGLTGQPNALMEMMNKQIERDFEAQKSTNANAQNWLRLSQAHALQEAQIPLMKAQAALVAAKTPYEADLAKANIENIKAETALKGQTSALTKMKISAFKELQGQVDKLPPGPQKDNAVTHLNNLNSAIQAENTKSNAVAATQIGAKNADLAQKIPPKENDSGVDMNKFNLLAKQGQMNESMGMPGGMRGSDVSEATKEATGVADNRNIAKIYNDSFHKLDQAALAGLLNPQLRAAELSSLGAEIARATAGRYNAAEAIAQADGMFPSSKDWGTARPEKFRKSMEYFAGQEAGTPTLDRFGLKTPFPKYELPKKGGKQNVRGASANVTENTSLPKDGATGTYQGKPVIYRNGKWTSSGTASK